MKHYDITIIGGGIQGAGVAQAAAARGFSVMLLEQNTFASGTSSRSSKLIHGGLRYLESADFSLVKQNLAERETLIKIAPHLVKRCWIHVPVYRRQRRSRLKLLAGFCLYWLLSGCKAHGRFLIVPKAQWATLTHLRQQDLLAVYAFQDAQTDDRALTQAVIASAESHHAIALQHALFLAAHKTDTGYDISYVHEGDTHQLSTSLLVNAAGPWVNEVIHKVEPTVAHLEIDRVQGSHLLLSEPLLDRPFYLEAPSDGRPVFVLPWQGKTLVGTTERLFQGDVSHIEANHDEINYLLDTLNHYFDLNQVDVESTFSGVRVLPGHHKELNQRSREPRLLFDNANDLHLITIYGGKLTGYRALAEQVMEHIETALGKRGDADTKQIPL